MNPEQQPYQQQPVIQPPQPEVTPTLQLATEKKSNKQPIILMVWPASALLLAILLYALSNMLFQPAAGDLFGSESPAKTILNVLLFIMSTASILLGPISFIIGLIMLIKRKK